MTYLENAKDIFRNLKDEMYQKLSIMIPNKINAEMLSLAIKIIFNDYKKEGYIIENRECEPVEIINKTADKEFASEFRICFYRTMFGIELPDISEKKQYGYKEIEENVIDISEKDVYEVIAELYNYAMPIGVGIGIYDSTIWDRDTAKMYCEYLKKQGENNNSFNHVLGRAMKLRIEDNKAYVTGYNASNCKGLAQKVIGSIKNKNMNEQNIK